MPEFDAIVIGSGVTGGWAAKELCEKGLKVLVLDRGKPITPEKDFTTALHPPWQDPLRGLPDRELWEADYPIQSQSYAFDETTRHFFNNDKTNPYVYDEQKPFIWTRADVVGGKSLLWNRQVYRFSDLDFAANQRDGHGNDWPIRYGDIEDWYSYVERFVGVSGEALGLPQLPDSEFQPPMELNHVEKVLRQSLQENYSNRHLTIGRVAIQTEPRNGRGACTYCFKCERGCTFNAAFSSLNATLPAARATGNLTLRGDSVVEGIDYDPQSARATAVRVIDANSGERRRFSARLIFLCGSTVGSTQILLNSTSETFPNGLGNSSGVLGRYLIEHTTGNGAYGLVPGYLDKYPYGYRPNGLYIPRFRNLQGAEQEQGFLRGYNFQGAALRPGWDINYKLIPGFGKAFKQAMHGPGPWVLYLDGFGEVLPHYDNRMYLHPTRKDRFGIPLVAFDFRYGANEEAMRADILREATTMLQLAGAIGIETFVNNEPGRSIHEMGTARMGDDPHTSFLNRWNQSHAVPNLFVTDGSCMPSASCVNPSLTYMALTVRAADYAVQQLRAGQI
ncbi:Choline dehydrogenase [Pseudomonas pohangensis]|uniref:Choline dehydrogenase n=1 Tax=Pseudomonas pohangensis TaxID=364197 RepID=A0A1H2FXG3_9PSED|nr:GMC family oxidoreductase [Pseudomonas pohangensis]SDU12064.1 Choline dehydrogenase [Pseudomonas pohangensis]